MRSPITMSLSIVLLLVSMIVLLCFELTKKVPINYILLFLFVRIFVINFLDYWGKFPGCKYNFILWYENSLSRNWTFHYDNLPFMECESLCENNERLLYWDVLLNIFRHDRLINCCFHAHGRCKLVGNDSILQRRNSNIWILCCLWLENDCWKNRNWRLCTWSNDIIRRFNHIVHLYIIATWRKKEMNPSVILNLRTSYKKL